MKSKNYIKISGAFVFAMPMVLASCGGDNDGNGTQNPQSEFEKSQEGKQAQSAIDNANGDVQNIQSQLNSLQEDLKNFDDVKQQLEAAQRKYKGEEQNLQKQVKAAETDLKNKEIDKNSKEAAMQSAEQEQKKAAAIKEAMEKIKEDIKVAEISDGDKITEIVSQINDLWGNVQDESGNSLEDSVKTAMQTRFTKKTVMINSTSQNIEFNSWDKLKTSVSVISSNVHSINTSQKDVEPFFKNNAFIDSFLSSAKTVYAEYYKAQVLMGVEKKVDEILSSTNTKLNGLGEKLKAFGVNKEDVKTAMEDLFTSTASNLFQTDGVNSAIDDFIDHYGNNAPKTFDSAKAAFDTAKGEFDKAQKVLDDLKKDLQAKQDELKKTQDKLNDFKDKATLQSKIDKKQNELNAAKAKKAEAEKKYNDAKNKFEKEQKTATTDTNKEQKEQREPLTAKKAVGNSENKVNTLKAVQPEPLTPRTMENREVNQAK